MAHSSFSKFVFQTTLRLGVRAEPVLEMDRLLQNEPTKKVLQKLRKFELSLNGDISMTKIFRDDAIIIEAVHAIGSYLNRVAPQVDHHSTAGTDTTLVIDQRKEISNEGGTIPRKELKVAVPATNLSRFPLEEYQNSVKGSEEMRELSVFSLA